MMTQAVKQTDPRAEREPSQLAALTPTPNAPELSDASPAPDRCGPGRPALRWLVTAALLASVAGVFVARTAFAKIVSNTIDPVARVSDKGRHLTVSGSLAVTAGETAYLRVTVTRRTTGAVAEGDALLSGTGTPNQWQVQATAIGKAVFAPGPATAVAIAVTTTRGETTDAHQWLVNITLE